MRQDLSEGFCPCCLIQAGIDLSAGAIPSLDRSQNVGEADNSPAQAVTMPPLAGRASFVASLAGCDFGDYELLEEIGRGGMGIVYRARQRRLNRVVAIKMIALDSGASPELIQRFRAEAIAAASLHHPHIVAIHDVGIHEGRHFFVMDYIEAASLAKLISNLTFQICDFRCAASYLKSVAEAVHYAHERGILHRDLKPSNVIIDAGGKPYVVDFGLARRLDGASEITLTGQVMGSPHYLPPEQAGCRRGRVSRRTDVYGLGATLYHLLTGRPPFQAESLAQTLDLVLHAEPVPPRLLNPRVPIDLETVCLKCIEKEPGKRYATAQAVAEELGRFLNGQPVVARPIGRAGRAWRACRQNPRLAVATAAAILSFLIGLSSVIWEWRRAESLRARAEAGERLLRRRGYDSDMNLAQQAIEANNQARAVELLRRYVPEQGSETLNVGSQAMNSRPAIRDLQLAGDADLPGWEWRYLWQQCRSDAEEMIGSLSGAVRDLALSRDSRFLAASSEFGVVKLWDLDQLQATELASETGVQSFLAFSPDGRWLAFTDQALGRPGTVGFWNTELRRRMAPLVGPHYVGPIGFSPDGRWFLQADLLPDGRASLRILDFAARKQVRARVTRAPIVDGHIGYAVVFTPSSQQVVFSENDGSIVAWDFLVDAATDPIKAHDDGVTAIAISPDGRTLATGAGYSETAIKLWEFPSFRSLGVLTNHQGWISDLKFSPDGRMLASSSADETIRLWDPAIWIEKRVLRGHRHDVMRLCYSADGRTLFSGARDGAIYRWPAESGPSGKGSDSVYTGLAKTALASETARFAGIREDGVYLGDMRNGRIEGPISALGTNVTSLLFRRAGLELIAGTKSGEIHVWSLSQGQAVRTLRGPSERVQFLRQDALGQTLLAVHRTLALLGEGPSQLQVWNLETGQPAGAWNHPRMPTAYALSPDGRRVATGHLPGVVLVWDLHDGLRTIRLGFAGRISDLAFSPDGKFFAAASREGMVKIWDGKTLRELQLIRAHSGPVHGIAFALDSQRFITASDGREAIRLWDVATWQPLLTLGKEGATLFQPAFSSLADGIVAINRQSGAEGEQVVRWQVTPETVRNSSR